MQTDATSVIHCPKCGSEQALNFKFCSRCGSRNPNITKKEEQTEEQFQIHLRLLGWYTIIVILLLLANTFTEETLEVVILTSIGFAILDFIFSFLQLSVWKLFLTTVSLLRIFQMIGLGVITGIVVTIFTDHLNLLLFDEKFEYMPVFYSAENPLFMAILMVAVFPAFTEELAFRGFVFKNLDVLIGRKSAIWGSAFLFGLVHFSLISLMWIIPFGLVLAYLRDKYSTLTYGIILHFSHNATTILLEYYGVF